jgi:hypothetical protein
VEQPPQRSARGAPIGFALVRGENDRGRHGAELGDPVDDRLELNHVADDDLDLEAIVARDAVALDDLGHCFELPQNP